MPDRIDKIDPNMGAYRVHETRESLEDGKENKEEFEGEEDERDSFDKLTEKTDWNILTSEQNVWKQNIEILKEDVLQVIFLGINLKTNPSLLNVRITLSDGHVIPIAILPISRTLAFKLKKLKRDTLIDVKEITSARSLRLAIPVNEEQLDREITRITDPHKETTLTEKVKAFISKKTLIQKIGVQDPVSKEVDNEILWVYFTIVIVLSAIIFGVVYLFI